MDKVITITRYARIHHIRVVLGHCLRLLTSITYVVVSFIHMSKLGLFNFCLTQS